MKKLEYQVRFTTPAFLGNAEQVGQWRTPPFKALLRQWWRIRNAKQCQYDYQSLREKEGELFGNAWLKPQNGSSRFRKSRVTLRLDKCKWSEGKLSSEQWPTDFERVATTRDGKSRVRADVYLGYGAVCPANRTQGRSISLRGKAINTNDCAVISLFPGEVANSLQDELQLIAWFGTIGSRARNGWGSLRLKPHEEARPLIDIPQAGNPLLASICREWTDCLGLDWPHALGSESSDPLVWITRKYDTWCEIMGCLANVRVAVRQVAKEFKEFGRNGIGGIHLLGYPAGSAWPLPPPVKRLATQLRFKVVQTDEGLVGVVAHFPCAFPGALMQKLEHEQKTWIKQNEETVWESIHKHLNACSRVRRLSQASQRTTT